MHACIGAAQLAVAPDETLYPRPALKRLVCRETHGGTTACNALVGVRHVRPEQAARRGAPRRTWMRLAGERLVR